MRCPSRIRYLGIILLLLYLNFRSLAKSLIVLLSVPVAAIEAVWSLDYPGYNLSVAVRVGRTNSHWSRHSTMSSPQDRSESDRAVLTHHFGQIGLTQRS